MKITPINPSKKHLDAFTRIKSIYSTYERNRPPMETAMLPTSEVQATITELETKISQQDEMLCELYRTFCSAYGEIDFMQLAPETFNTPYSIHSINVLGTALQVTLVTTPPHLTIGIPDTHSAGTVQWEHELEIQLPVNTRFVNFRYGGGTGTVEWFGADGKGHPLSSLLSPTASNPTRIFQFAQSAGIRSLKITGNGDIQLYSVAMGIS